MQICLKKSITVYSFTFFFKAFFIKIVDSLSVKCALKCRKIHPTHMAKNLINKSTHLTI